ncbi:MAG: hypothetical protein OXF68_09340 [Gammaproteobacteria bacterium]|nr:hypothetical protein [Gammaproteobacteria bacterium]
MRTRSFKAVRGAVRGAAWALAVLGTLAQPVLAREHMLPLFLSTINAGQPSASGITQQGFMRVINHSDEAAEVSLVGYDDAGQRRGPVTLTLASRSTVHLNSGDVEGGNADKGLPDGLGAPTRGDWRLVLESRQDIEPLAYIRTLPDGFLTSMSAMAPSGAMRHRVSIFNPAKNDRQRSWLRVVNLGDAAANVTISGVDDAGSPAPGGAVGLTLARGEAKAVTAQGLESGASDLTGSFGDKQAPGKWQLTVSSDQPLVVMSLLNTPTGHLSNLSAPRADYLGAAGVWQLAHGDGLDNDDGDRGYLILTTDSRLYGWLPTADGGIEWVADAAYASRAGTVEASGKVYESGEVEIRGLGIAGGSEPFRLQADYRQGDWIKGTYSIDGQPREFQGRAFAGFDRGTDASALAGAWTTSETELSFSLNADAAFQGKLEVESFECDLSGAVDGINPAFNLYESTLAVDCGLLRLDVEMIIAISDRLNAPGGNDLALALVIARDQEVAVGTTATR